MALPAWARDEADGAVLALLVAPRASRTRIAGEHDGRLKIMLAAPPVDGEANAALVSYLARVLGVPKARISIAQGLGARRKAVRLAGVSAACAVDSLLSG
ncbi:MAG TPA: DUF167 domain-containing protein [Anaeromyxobacteraceae bacterium]|nr:DUF167 domain-containing protein [Anaeromyxobacteraceae bacterium]